MNWSETEPGPLRRDAGGSPPEQSTYSLSRRKTEVSFNFTLRPLYHQDSPWYTQRMRPEAVWTVWQSNPDCPVVSDNWTAQLVQSRAINLCCCTSVVYKQSMCRARSEPDGTR